jgi:glutamate dehydrogenase (NADP+)
MNGMFSKLARLYHTGVLTGKGETWGGSILRPEATGFGALYFVEHMLKRAGKDIKGKTVVVSGFGNVAWGASKKATELGAKVIGISGPDGVVSIPGGMTSEMIDYLLDLRASNQNIVAPFAGKFASASTFTAGKKAWSIPCDIALPCAFQNELNGDDAAELLKNGTWCCAEVSNMGCTPGAIHAFQKAGILFAPGKAVNAGGVATSGLEMTQNSMHISWSGREVDERLHTIMESIHEACVKFGTLPGGSVDYVKGANIAGFMKVAQAMLEQGIVYFFVKNAHLARFLNSEPRLYDLYYPRFFVYRSAHNMHVFDEKLSARHLHHSDCETWAAHRSAHF